MSQNEGSAEALGRALLAECERRLLGESLPRLERCLGLLDEAEIWHRPNPETVSVGNLVLHLCGNVRQWILSGLGGATDERVRDREFAETGPVPRADLLRLLASTLGEVPEVLHRLDPTALAEPRRVQGFEETGVSILVHVVEHFSYHVGQVSYAVKARKGLDLGYYAGTDLDRSG